MEQLGYPRACFLLRPQLWLSPSSLVISDAPSREATIISTNLYKQHHSNEDLPLLEKTERSLLSRYLTKNP